MNEDSILREIRAAREEYARLHGFDVHKIVADLQKKVLTAGWTVVRLPPRRPTLAGVASAGAKKPA